MRKPDRWFCHKLRAATSHESISVESVHTSLASARPAAPPALKGAHPHANRTTASFGESESACRDDSLCRLSYRDGGNILVGEAGRRLLRTLIGEHLDVRLTH